MMPTKSVESTHDIRGRYFPAEGYDIVSTSAFQVCCHAGIRSHHHVLEFQCNSLALGRYLMLYLEPGHYSGVGAEPDSVSAGIADLGAEFITSRRPRFFYDMLEFGKTKYLRKSYDYIVAWMFFQFAAPKLIHVVLEQLAKVMNSNSVLLGAYYEHDVSIYPSDVEWTWPKHVGYSRRQFDAIFANGNFSTPEVKGSPFEFDMQGNPLRLTWFKSHYLGASHESDGAGK